METLEEFRSLLAEAGLIDDRYDATGSYVWFPYGLRLRERMLSMLEDHFTNEGYDRYGFPILIPESYLRQQEEAVLSFEDAVCWVDRFGAADLEEPYYLRPTGEAQIYPMAEQWIRSYRDLPLKLLLIEPMFRAFKGGTPLLAGQGLHLVEGHGFHRNRESAEWEVEAAMKYINEALAAVGLDGVLVVQRPLWGNHPVSERNIGFDVVTPLDRTILAASLYMQGEIYSGPYNLEYRDESNERRTVTTIDWGLSTRVLGISLLLLADDRGFRVLPELSPVQVVFVCINGTEEEVAYAENLAKAVPFRTEIDADGEDLGRRFERWEQRGVPLRVEIGPEELDGGALTIFRRDTNSRFEMDVDTHDQFSSSVGDLLDEVAETLRAETAAIAEENVRAVEDRDSILGAIEDGDVARFNYCGAEDCGRTIEDSIDGEIIGTDLEATSDGRCVNCGVATDRIAYASRRF